MIKNKKICISIMLAFTVMLGVVGCSGNGRANKADKNSPVVATINGEALSETDYRAYLFSVKMEMEQMFGPDVWEIELEGENMENIAKERALESAVAMEVTSKKAKEMKIDLTSEEKEEAKKIATDYFTQLKDPLTEEGITENSMRKMMENISLFQKVLQALSEQFAPTENPEEFTKFMEENKDFYEMATAQHVLINTVDEGGNPLPEEDLKKAKEKADDILQKALAGEDMGELAKEYSEDPGSKDSGGEYTFPRGQMVPEFEDVAFSAEEGKVYPELVKTSYGYHIMKVVKKPGLDEDKMKQDFEESQKANYVNGEVDEWIKSAKIEKTEEYDKVILKKLEAQDDANSNDTQTNEDEEEDTKEEK